MPIDETTPDPNIDKLATRLNDGLKTCRSMVSNYRALLEVDEIDLKPPAVIDEPSAREP